MLVAHRTASNEAERIPFVDLSTLHAPIQKEIELEISRLASSSSFVLGPAVDRFEENFAAYCGSRYAVACSSGTAAIHMALAALDIGPGDEVITVSHTFIGTVWGVLYCGAVPVFADIDVDTMNMDVGKVESLITEKTRAIIPVHLYGQPVDMAPLLELAERHRLYVIEDAAQAHGARYRDKPAGSMGHIGCFSFYPGKNLGAWGEGGAVITSDPDLAGRLRRLRDHGQPQRYIHATTGFNYRMDAIQAAVLDIKLRYLDGWNDMRREIAAFYSTRLAETGLRLPATLTCAEHVYHLYVVRHTLRDRLIDALDGAGIDTGLHYPIPLHKQLALKNAGFRAGSLSITEETAAGCFSLPLYPGMPLKSQQSVADRLLHLLDTVE